MIDIIYFISSWTLLADSKLHVEQIINSCALNTVGSVEERSGKWTIINIFIDLTPFIILID